MKLIKVFKIILLFLRTVLCLLLIFVFANVGFNFTLNLSRLNSKDKIPKDLLLEYNYLKSLLDKLVRKERTSTDGSYNFALSEWPVMTYSFFCFGARNLVLKDHSLKEEVSQYMLKAIERVMKPEYYHFAFEHYGDPLQSDNIYDNVFYLGHFTLMLATYREISGDPRFDELFHKFVKAFYENYSNSPTYSLDSYPGLCWISEQTVPLRAIKIHDDIFGTHYGEIIERWKITMQKRFTEQVSGLLITQLDKVTGVVLEGPRTITNGFSIIFLYDILPEFCQKLYTNMKRELMVYRLGFPVFKEYLGDNQYSTGDTGPIIWGVSAVSTAFGMGAAAVIDDQSVYQPIRFLADVSGLGITFANKKKYLIGGCIGTAVIFFCKSFSLFSQEPTKTIPIKNIIFLYSFVIIFMFLFLWWLKALIREWRLEKKYLKF